ncbi:PH domain-containing protein [Clostridium cibarium]|uniref:PH domain-containing protein n=1 Tax=Clostridium cibarium TaxID=2762247 RepID=A0ABR8PVP7_9CLOT|nr:PH domain-containing protein [Clostridium cibarium]MBD7912224.1 PH domain-containing protein [Clostridium cibarium]
MIDNPTRNHWIIIVYDIINSIKNFWVLLILMLSYREKYLFIGIAVVLVGIIAVAIKKWLNTEFYLNDNMLVYKTGIFERSKQEIPFNKINTIDIGKTLLDRIFDICTVKIDSGSAVEKKSEFKIKLQYVLAENLRDNILKGKNNINIEKFEENKKGEPIERIITIKEIIIYAVTKSKLGWAIGGCFALFNFTDNVKGFVKTSVVKDLSQSINISDSFLENRTSLIIIIICMIVIAYIIVILLSIIYEIVKLYQFSIKVQNKNFSISYGMFSKKEYSIPIEKIHALKYKQGMLQQLLGIYTLEVITIGYGDERNEKAILYPIANDKFNKEFLGKILPEMIFLGKVNKPPKSSIKRFIFLRVITTLIILILLYFIIKAIPSELKLGIIVIITLINILLGYFNYKNTSLGVTKKIILASSGSLTKTTTLIKQSSIQSIEKTENPFQRKDKVCDYKIDIYSNNLAEAVEVRHMSEELDGILYKNLII